MLYIKSDSIVLLYTSFSALRCSVHKNNCFNSRLVSSLLVIIHFAVVFCLVILWAGVPEAHTHCMSINSTICNENSRLELI